MLLAPTAYPIYRGFVLTLPLPIPGSLVEVEYQARKSTDDSVYDDWKTIVIVTEDTNYSYAHQGLLAGYFYEYRYRLYETDFNNNIGTSDWSDVGQGGAVFTEDLSGITRLDQIASNLGTMTSGILRGLIFETSAMDPKVRMDVQRNFFVTDNSGKLLVQLSGGQGLLRQDPNDGITYVLGKDPSSINAVWIAASTWTRAKSIYGSVTWGQAKNATPARNWYNAKLHVQ